MNGLKLAKPGVEMTDRRSTVRETILLKKKTLNDIFDDFTVSGKLILALTDCFHRSTIL